VETKRFEEGRSEGRMDREESKSLCLGAGLGEVDMEIDFIVSEAENGLEMQHEGCRAGYQLFLYLS
jgi:hypothetical protein